MIWKTRPAVSDSWPFDVLDAGPAPPSAPSRTAGYLKWVLAFAAAFAAGTAAEPLAHALTHTQLPAETLLLGSLGYPPLDGTPI